ncbi:MAG: PIN domain-containing protein [Bacteroidetes bacterium]|jgi:predicted nucleic acid-binding protein|nr:PIN domain-containing protein [Bacteroidota bacterium]
MIFYLDASAWIKRYVVETGSRRIRHWVAEGPLLFASPLGLIEVLATLARKERAGELETGAMRTSMASAQTDYERFAIVPLDPTIDRARQLLVQYRLRGADTLHLAAALWVDALPAFDDELIALITSDRELAEATQAAGLGVFDPTRDVLPGP